MDLNPRNTVEKLDQGLVEHHFCCASPPPKCCSPSFPGRIWMLWHAEGSKPAWIRTGLLLAKWAQETIWNRYIVGQHRDIIRKEMVKDDWELSAKTHTFNNALLSPISCKFFTILRCHYHNFHFLINFSPSTYSQMQKIHESAPENSAKLTCH